MGLVYNAFLPPVIDSDVVTRKLKFVVNGDVSVLSVDPKATVFELPPVKDGSSVELSVCDIDDAGNESGYNQPLKFTAVDTIVPAVPGAVNVKIVKEVPDEITPVAEPPPAPVVEPETPTKVEVSAVVKPTKDND